MNKKVAAVALLCDDDKLVIEKCLDECNISAVFFDNFDDVDKLLCLDAVDVLITDLVLRGMTGFGFAKKVRAAFPSVFTIVLGKNPSFALDAYKNDINAYMLKPVAYERLMHKLRSL